MTLAPTAVVLAAGKGTRMKSDLPKVLFPVLGRPMIHWVLDSLEKAGIKKQLVVVGYREDLVREELKHRSGVEFVLQAQQLGTGHAVLVCAEHLKKVEGRSWFWRAIRRWCKLLQSQIFSVRLN